MYALTSPRAQLCEFQDAVIRPRVYFFWNTDPTQKLLKINAPRAYDAARTCARGPPIDQFLHMMGGGMVTQDQTRHIFNIPKTVNSSNEKVRTKTTVSNHVSEWYVRALSRLAVELDDSKRPKRKA